MNETKNPHAVALGRLGGQQKSAEKAAAARKNLERYTKRKFTPCKSNRKSHWWTENEPIICRLCKISKTDATISQQKL